MEYWDGDVSVLRSHVADAGNNTLTFDFATKYGAFNNGIAGGNYNGCKGAGMPGAGLSRYAVTFLDSHDSFQRDDNEFLGKNNSMKNAENRAKVMQCNAYLLSMPGIPCLFYPHWVTFKEDLKKLINARYKTGVHSESAVSDEAGNGFYKATITGTNGSIRLLLGPNSGYNTTPQGYTLAAKGSNWGVYYQLNEPRGDNDANRVPIGEAIERVEEQRPVANKIIENGQLYLIKDGRWYNAMGQQVK
jgi:alpha-amylase